MKNIAMNVGQPAVDAVATNGQPRVIDSRTPRGPRVDGVAVSDLVGIGGYVRPLIAFAVTYPALDAPAR